ncbi:MAG: WD40-repeat-containing domain protein, partial [Linnemannia gamsii]
KRKKPKSNIGKTNSTFVAKITTNENLAKILASRVNEDVYLFWNTGRTFTWSDLGQKPNPLSHISFSKAFPTAHDVNILTRSCDHLDVIIGFSTGDIIWFNPLSNKYSRLNKQAIIKDSAVTMIKWLPGSESQFMVAFQDGSIVMMDKDKDDGAFSTPTPPEENSFHATKPKHGRHNPISHWHISKKPINAFAFSPDLQHVAVVAADGELRIIDFRNERLIETFSSYFGALSCVCWSPDGKYILTGGQDDLVTIWSFKDLRIVARCQGHQNYVTGVAFDSWRCDERNYRFGSVGEDAKLLLWDFSVGSLHKPKAQSHQNSLSTMFHHPNTNNNHRKSEDATTVTTRGSVDAERDGEGQVVTVARPPERRSRVAMLQPLMATVIHREPLASITFREDAILTSDRRGHIKVWKRPMPPPPPPVIVHS